MSTTSDNNLVVLYDGQCGLCNKSVQLILDQDRRGTARFAALQSDYGEQVRARYPSLKNVDSVVLLETLPGGKERVYTRSDAALRIASYLGGGWKFFLAFKIVPRPMRDFLYNMVAKYRYRMFGKYDTCMLPSPDVRSRFLDLGQT